MQVEVKDKFVLPAKMTVGKCYHNLIFRNNNFNFKEGKGVEYVANWSKHNKILEIDLLEANDQTILTPR